ncbi:unnamed protein product [Rhizoctonia solani]|uniref:Uncharacterized protein n=1 Tax=Rhizoctonia solani TaxID=456999 RepID=A0A8H2X365_9AGAM|nr:unnamed protein product [Rhizoctonia solani]
MGRRLPYPDVPTARIHEIYKQSLRKPIHAFGFYVDQGQLYLRKQGSPPPNVSIGDDIGRLLWETRLELLAAGLPTLSLAWVPIPDRFRENSCGDEAWLIVLATGFDKTPHLPIQEELTQRVRAILKTEEPPAWWSMRSFTYPPPELWIKHRQKKLQQTEA